MHTSNMRAGSTRTFFALRCLCYLACKYLLSRLLYFALLVLLLQLAHWKAHKGSARRCSRTRMLLLLLEGMHGAEGKHCMLIWCSNSTS
jgi:hypothetical protein